MPIEFSNISNITNLRDKYKRKSVIKYEMDIMNLERTMVRIRM